MFWLTQIILKNLKINLSETTVFRAWHPDAPEYYNKCGASLRKVFNTMTDTAKRFATVCGCSMAGMHPCTFSFHLFYTSLLQDIVPGRAVRPQLALGTGSVAYAFKRMHSKEGDLHPFVVETKFDGERIQLHRDASGEHLYFSRRAIEHGERSNYRVFDPVVTAQIQASRFILDGEMVVWNCAR